MNPSQHPMDPFACATSPRLETGALAESKLHRSGYMAMQRLACEFHAGVLTLRGRLPSYYLKQMALAIVASVEGIQRIDDQVEVSAHTARNSAGFPDPAPQAAEAEHETGGITGRNHGVSD